MYQNNLRVILAKKKLKISHVSKETGISRTTLTALYYEKAKGIQFETLHNLCFYLNCSAGDLLDVDKE